MTTVPAPRTDDDPAGHIRFARVGIALVVAGAIVAAVGFLTSSGDNRFEITNLSDAAAVAGVAIVVIGIGTMLLARPLSDLYRRGGHVTLQRRIMQVGLPAAAFVAVFAIAATIANAHRS